MSEEVESFPLFVTEPATGKIHRFLSSGLVTVCGRYCGNWPILVGGEADCVTCRSSNG
jgi:hypothetical protein